MVGWGGVQGVISCHGVMRRLVAPSGAPVVARCMLSPYLCLRIWGGQEHCVVRVWCVWCMVTLTWCRYTVCKLSVSNMTREGNPHASRRWQVLPILRACLPVSARGSTHAGTCCMGSIWTYPACVSCSLTRTHTQPSIPRPLSALVWCASSPLVRRTMLELGWSAC